LGEMEQMDEGGRDSSEPTPGTTPKHITTREAVRRMRALTSPEGIVMQVGRRSKYGSRPHPTDAWGYTRQLLVKRGEEDSLEEIIAIFRDLGLDDEVSASKWLEHNLSQDELADKSGVAWSTIAKLELGDHTPNLDTLRRLARVLGYRVLDVDYGWRRPPKKAGRPRKRVNTPIEEEGNE
jgi:DNA-binding XRE family transcriptional regulator